MSDAPAISCADYIESFAASPLGHFGDWAPWELTHSAENIVRAMIGKCGSEYYHRDGLAVHARARIEAGANIKPPAIIGPDCFIASTALVRGGCWLDRGVIIGPAAELKSSFVFAGAKLAHLNFVGDSVLGADVNIEAGAMLANYRNERPDKRIRIRFGGALIDTGIEKFGALIGDHARIGANAVIAPGAIVPNGVVVPRLALVDQG